MRRVEMKRWDTLLSAKEARRIFAEHFRPAPVPEEVATAGALGRIVAEEIRAPEDLPPFRRSLMDGFAVRAADLAGAPISLEIVAEVRMGEPAGRPLQAGEAARIPTGGMLPGGADTVVPVELVEAGPATVTVREPLAAGRHMIERGEDVCEGELLLSPGHRLRPPDLGALMGLGITRVVVTQRPRVGVLSTGDEMVAPDESPPFGKVRDMNSYSLAAAVEVLGAVATRHGIVPDTEQDLFRAAAAALAESDLLVLNGGSSVGERDLVATVIDQLGRPGVLVHGVNIRPGKPTIFALCGGKPVFGLPGQPVSALNTFDLFVAPVLRSMLGLPPAVSTVRARLVEAVRSADGREDHVRVSLESQHGVLWARPIPGISAMISGMVRAQGITVVPAGAPGFEAGAEVEVRLIE